MQKSLRNPLEIYKILPRTNCGKCLLPSCLAFAAAVAGGGKRLADCPDLHPSLVGQDGTGQPGGAGAGSEQAESVEKLRKKMAGVDFAAVAPLIGATVRDNRLVINSLGKDFWVDASGAVSSECHIIPWVQMPLLACIINPTHAEISGKWISFREFEGGLDWQGLFAGRCEEPLRRLADANPGLLADLIDLFMGRTIDWYEADIALILHPLPKVPILICYQAPEGDLASTLTILFDQCCERNLPIRALYAVCAGLVQMFTKIAERHR
ncbi:DUF3786 domain-containing protein [Thiovibrio sp. JS02]